MSGGLTKPADETNRAPRVGPSMRNAQRSVDAVPELPCGHSLFVR